VSAAPVVDAAMPDPRVVRILEGLGASEPSEAWGEFLESYVPLIIRVVRFFERDEDRVSDCFLFICESLAQGRFRRLRKFRPKGPASFETWLRAVVRNLCLDWHRREFGRQRVSQTILSLPLLDQAVFRCFYEQDCSPESTAACLAARFPAIKREQVEESVQRIEQVLSPRQRSLLRARRSGAGFDGDRPASGEEDLLHQVADLRPDPESAASRREQLAALQKALWRLPGQERLLVFFRFVQDLTLEEVARVFRWKGNQEADRRIREVLNRLRREMG